MTSQAVVIATPTSTGSVVDGYLHGARDLLIAGLPHALITRPHDPMLPHTRAHLQHCFLQRFPQATHLLWIDADITFRASDVDALLMADKDIIGGIYARKTCPARATGDIRSSAEPTAEGLVQAVSLPTGFLLLKRSAVEAIASASLTFVSEEPDSAGERVADSFRTMIDDAGNYLYDDEAYSARARELGIELWAHLGVNLGHVGAHTFRMPRTDIAPAIVKQFLDHHRTANA